MRNLVPPCRQLWSRAAHCRAACLSHRSVTRASSTHAAVLTAVRAGDARVRQAGGAAVSTAAPALPDKSNEGAQRSIQRLDTCSGLGSGSSALAKSPCSHNRDFSRLQHVGKGDRCKRRDCLSGQSSRPRAWQQDAPGPRLRACGVCTCNVCENGDSRNVDAS